jgi:hypothetical protein
VIGMTALFFWIYAIAGRLRRHRREYYHG